MAAPAEKKRKIEQEGAVVPSDKKESTMISMLVEKWTDGQVEQFSPVQRINGYPWRLRLTADNNYRQLFLICDKSSEAELWQCIAMIRLLHLSHKIRHKFTSWNKESHEIFIESLKLQDGFTIQMKIATNGDGKKWRVRPTLGPSDLLDRTFVIGEDKKKIHVNKESLASQSFFFDKLFNGDFKEKNMVEIPIGDVEFEEFSNIINMVYGVDGTSLSDENVHRVLELADRFDLKIVEDRVVSFLLSTSSSLTIHQKLLISDQCNIPFLKKSIISRYDKKMLTELSESEEMALLSSETLLALFPQ